MWYGYLKQRKRVCGKLRKEIGEILRRLSEYKGVDVIEGESCIDSFYRFRGSIPYQQLLGI